MKTRFVICFVCLFFYNINQAYAVFDLVAFVQSKLELATEIKDKVQEELKKLREMQKRLTQGFNAASNCFKNPMNCDVNAVSHFAATTAVAIDNRIKEARVMGDADELQDDIQNTEEDGLADVVEDSYIYERGAGDDVTRLEEYKEEINAIVADDVAILFAKATSARQAIITEDGTLYTTEFTQDNVDEILRAQNIVEIATQQRLNRIVELRAYMFSAPLTLDISNQENDDSLEE